MLFLRLDRHSLGALLEALFARIHVCLDLYCDIIHFTRWKLVFRKTSEKWVSQKKHSYPNCIYSTHTSNFLTGVISMDAQFWRFGSLSLKAVLSNIFVTTRLKENKMRCNRFAWVACCCGYCRSLLSAGAKWVLFARSSCILSWKGNSCIVRVLSSGGNTSNDADTKLADRLNTPILGVVVVSLQPSESMDPATSARCWIELRVRGSISPITFEIRPSHSSSTLSSLSSWPPPPCHAVWLLDCHAYCAHAHALCVARIAVSLSLATSAIAAGSPSSSCSTAEVHVANASPVCIKNH